MLCLRFDHNLKKNVLLVLTKKLYQATITFKMFHLYLISLIGDSTKSMFQLFLLEKFIDLSVSLT